MNQSEGIKLLQVQNQLFQKYADRTLDQMMKNGRNDQRVKEISTLNKNVSHDILSDDVKDQIIKKLKQENEELRTLNRNYKREIERKNAQLDKQQAIYSSYKQQNFRSGVKVQLKNKYHPFKSILYQSAPKEKQTLDFFTEQFSREEEGSPNFILPFMFLNPKEEGFFQKNSLLGSSMKSPQSTEAQHSKVYFDQKKLDPK